MAEIRTNSVLMPGSFVESHKRAMANHVKTGESRVIGQTVELAGLTKGGLEFPLGLSISTQNKKPMLTIRPTFVNRMMIAFNYWKPQYVGLQPKPVFNMIPLSWETAS
jgi:hypothetical protein